MDKGRQLHNRSAATREKENDLLKSLQLADEALIEYAREDNKSGIAELIADRSITFRHLFRDSGNRIFLLIARSELGASIDIASMIGRQDSLIVPFYNLAKIEVALTEFEPAITHYKKALSLTQGGTAIPPNPDNPAQNRPSVAIDIRFHLAQVEYLNGDETALPRMEEEAGKMGGVEEPDDFSKHIWLSGQYLTLAELLKNTDHQKAKEYFLKAKAVIDSDQRLTIRKKEMENLVDSFR